MDQWDTIIKSETGYLDIPIREVWKYRGLIYMLTKRNYDVQYKQTILGPVWMIISPIISSGLFSFVFGYVGNFSSGGIPYFLFYLSGSVLWNFFSGCLVSNTDVFQANAYLFGKIYFPRLVVPLSNLLFEFIRFCIQLGVFVCVWSFYALRGEVAFMGVYVLFIPGLLAEVALLGMSIGLLISSLTTKYRDLSHFVGLGVIILMYASPMLYPISQLPDFLQRIILLNPVASAVEAFRYVLTGSGGIHWGSWLYSAVFTAALCFASLVLFNQTEKTFIDIV
ncbi:MAG: ABC transporter permease [Clostridiales bacterium]|nr:ABC transporter permease [Clostridiales bacterium]